MNKELQALKELKKRYGKKFSCQDDERCRVIETALKRLERIDNTKLIIIGNPSPNESAVNKLINERMFVGNPREMEIKPLYDEVVDKKLKALEIIKEKGLHYLEISMFKSNLSYEDYLTEMNITIGVKPMIDSKIKTQEEYDLLKEVLKDERKS